MKRLRITHVTRYEYARPVLFGPHRLMLRPRDSHDLRLLSAVIDIAPVAELAWYHDVFGNSIASASFRQPAATLAITSELLVESFHQPSAESAAEAGWLRLPMHYDDDDVVDLGGFLDAGGMAPSPVLSAWVDGFAGCGGVLALLSAMSRSIRRDFRYEVRHEENTREPEETLWRRSGSCRDFAALFIAGARRLGIAARFVSGYLFSSLQTAGADSASTHAWAEVFLPGIGWVEFDPTNVPVATDRRIRVAVARAPWQALPVAGSFTGATNDFIGLWVGVSVSEA